MLHKIRSRAYLTGNDSVLAVADVNIDDAVIIRDCRLLKSADGNIEAQLPQIKNKDGTYTQTVQLINYQSVLMKSLKASIFEAYTNALKGNPPVSKEKTFEMEKEQFELKYTACCRKGRKNKAGNAAEIIAGRHVLRPGGNKRRFVVEKNTDSDYTIVYAP